MPCNDDRFDILQPYVNLTNSELLFAHGQTRQHAVRCRRQALFLHFLYSILIFFCNCRVNYPGLPGSYYHEIAKTQMYSFGAMLSFEPEVNAEAFVKNLRLIKPAVSLGGIETTICAPAVTSHAKMTQEERKRAGITDSLLRLSVGIENIDDLLEDIEKALKDSENI